MRNQLLQEDRPLSDKFIIIHFKSAL